MTRRILMVPLIPAKSDWCVKRIWNRLLGSLWVPNQGGKQTTSSGVATVTFPIAFNIVPETVFATGRPADNTPRFAICVWPNTIAGATFGVYDKDGTGWGTSFSWLAIGR